MNTSAILIVAVAATVAPLSLALAQTGTTTPAGITWNADTYDPKPDKSKNNGELTLPMPCGGAMVFRKVVVRSNDGQNDRRFTIGSDKAKREVHLAGPFGPATSTQFSAKETYYYLAKYELSKAQYDAILVGNDPNKCWTGGSATPKDELDNATPDVNDSLKCPIGGSATPKGGLNNASLDGNDPEKCPLSANPKSGISQIGARQAADFYTKWLKSFNAKALQSVESEGHSENVIVRLPTEPEWEFAARGGMVAGKAQFERVQPYYNETSPEEIDHFFTLESDGNRPKNIGYGLPNALGLYNMLGNVSELTDDAFSPVSNGRLVGLTGNPLVKGGSYRDQFGSIDLGMRSEMKTYGVQGGVTPGRWIGVRFILSTPVEDSVKQIQMQSERQNAEGKKSLRPKEDWVELFKLIENMHRSCSAPDNKDESEFHKKIKDKATVLRNEYEYNGPVNLRFLIINGATQLSMIKEYKFMIKWVSQARDCLPNEESDPSAKCIPHEKKVKYIKIVNDYIKRIESNNNITSRSIAGYTRIRDVDEIIFDLLEEPNYYYIADSVCSPELLPGNVLADLEACKERKK